jgi:threonyl-tRNA synthetase
MIPPLAHADYAHSFCSTEEVRGELISSLQFIDKIIKMFGFGSYWQIIGPGKRFAGTKDRWEQIQEYAVQALSACGFTAEESTEETAYLGPKLQCCLVDSLGREWGMPSISLDIGTPEKLGLRCQGSGGTTFTPLIVTTRLFGSLEKFIGVLVEHMQGELPLGLSPEQVRVIAIGPKQREYAESAAAVLRASGIRVNVDADDDQLGKRIHEAERQRVPYVVVLGEQEARGNTLSIRARDSGRGEMRSMTTEEFLNVLLQTSKNFASHREDKKTGKTL